MPRLVEEKHLTLYKCSTSTSLELAADSLTYFCRISKFDSHYSTARCPGWQRCLFYFPEVNCDHALSFPRKGSCTFSGKLRSDHVQSCHSAYCLVRTFNEQEQYCPIFTRQDLLLLFSFLKLTNIFGGELCGGMG